LGITLASLLAGQTSYPAMAADGASEIRDVVNEPATLIGFKLMASAVGVRGLSLTSA
jgi:hypothetical protein